MEIKGFTDNKMFDLVMENREICEHILQTVFPDKEFQLTEDKMYNGSTHIQSAVSGDGTPYDIYLQPTTEHGINLGKLMRKCQTVLDRDALEAQNMDLLKDTIVLLFCNNKDMPESLNVYGQYEDRDAGIVLETRDKHAVINGLGKSHRINSKEFLDLLRLIRNEPVEDDPILKRAEQIIKDNSEN